MKLKVCKWEDCILKWSCKRYRVIIEAGEKEIVWHFDWHDCKDFKKIKRIIEYEGLKISEKWFDYFE